MSWDETRREIEREAGWQAPRTSAWLWACLARVDALERDNREFIGINRDLAEQVKALTRG